MALSSFAKNSRYSAIALILLQLSQGVAGSLRVTHAMNGRSGDDPLFQGKGNIQALIPEGTEGDVLERWLMPTGNYGVKMKVRSIPESIHSSDIKVGQEYWVYYHQDKDLRLLELYDDKNQLVEKLQDKAGRPQGTWAKAIKTFRVNSDEAKSAVCDHCPRVNPLDHVEKNLNAAKIIEAVKEIPVIDEAVEEIVTYLNRIRKQTVTNRRIARAVLDEVRAARKKGSTITPTFVLGTIGAESTFDVSEISGVGAKGLMQLMPDAWAEVMGKGVPRSHDIETNIRAGVRYLAKMLKREHGDEAMALYAYKNGPGNADDFRAGRERKSKTSKIYEKNVFKFEKNYLAYEAKTKRKGSLLAMN